MESTAPETGTKPDINAVISKKFIEQLRGGKIPWNHPWSEVGPPVNLVTGHHFTGINAILLGMEGFERNWFLSFDQVNGLGGKVQRGARGQTLIRWNTPKEAGQKGFPKGYTVFNIAQCDKVPGDKLPAPWEKKANWHGLIQQCMPRCPKIEQTSRDAYYDLGADVIYMPKMKNKKNELLYHWQLFHLLMHSTGHSSRLTRPSVTEMGELSESMRFSREELVAEIGTCMLASITGMTLDYELNAEHAAGWAEKLEDDNWLIINAASDAQRAVDYILDRKDS